ncbi:hypothetical protein A2U01_0090448, partial [Trifolium medium]|nr:hypothetical protein [Trifolium medium]
MDNRAWKTVIKGWTHPIVTAEDGNTSSKPEADWSEAEDTESL